MQTAPIDLTQIIVALISFSLPVLTAWGLQIVKTKIKDRRMDTMLENAVNNSLGIIQQVATGAVVDASPQLVGVVPAKIAPGVQYVLNHAAEAVTWFSKQGTGMPPEKIGEKITARIGLKEIETNLAVTASSASAAVVPPLSPSLPAVASNNEPKGIITS